MSSEFILSIEHPEYIGMFLLGMSMIWAITVLINCIKLIRITNQRRNK